MSGRLDPVPCSGIPAVCDFFGHTVVDHYQFFPWNTLEIERQSLDQSGVCVIDQGYILACDFVAEMSILTP